jgi:hypothetical protein
MISIIVLIIASHNEIYDSFIALWREKISLWKLREKDDIVYRFFFVFSDPSLKYDILCDDENDSIFCKYEESLEPGIMLKTMAAIRYCEKNMKYDYILRTNLSSFWNFPVFSLELKTKPIDIGTIFLQYLDRNQLFVNSRWKDFFDIIDCVLPSRYSVFTFLDGAGFLLSHKMISLLLFPISDVLYSKLLLLPDDVAITVLMYYNILFHSCLSIEIQELLIQKKYISCKDIESFDLIAEIGFIRNKNDFGDRNIDILNYKTQIDFYRKLI